MRNLETRLQRLERAAPRPAPHVRTVFGLTLEQQARIVSAFVDVLDLDGVSGVNYLERSATTILSGAVGR